MIIDSYSGYASDPDRLYKDLTSIEESVGYLKAIEETKREAKAQMEALMLKRAQEAEAMIEEAEWVTLLHKYLDKDLPHEEVFTIVKGMKEKGFKREQVKTLLDAWVVSQKNKARSSEPKPTPKPEAFGSWA